LSQAGQGTWPLRFGGILASLHLHTCHARLQLSPPLPTMPECALLDTLYLKYSVWYIVNF
jgi:hypothetical protein